MVFLKKTRMLFVFKAEGRIAKNKKFVHVATTKIYGGTKKLS
jgi:hypothetical protein